MLTSFLRRRFAPLSPRKRVPGFMEPLVRPLTHLWRVKFGIGLPRGMYSLLIIAQRVIETFSSVPGLSRRWRDHFYDLSTSRLRAGLRIPLDRLGAAVSPADKS